MSLFKRKKQPHPAIVIAPDKFKGTLTAAEAAEVMRRALADILSSARVEVCPMADGGEGTAAIIAMQRGLEPDSRYLPDPLGRMHAVEFFCRDGVAAVDSAAAIGLTQIEASHRAPMQSSSYPLGLLVKELMDEGAERIMIGIGGTATVDGGAGFLQALGARYLDVDGEELPAPLAAERLGDVYTVDFSLFPHRQLRRVLVGLADVDVPLEGSLDYAPQKGVTPPDMERLRDGLRNFSQAVDEALMGSGADGHFYGAGGGLGYALGRVIGCAMHPGGEYIVDMYDIFGGAEQPELIITGEGCIDRQTTAGKVVWQLYTRARQRGIPVLALVGRNRLGESPDGMEIEATEPFMRGYELTRARAICTLDVAARQSLAALCACLWP